MMSILVLLCADVAISGRENIMNIILIGMSGAGKSTLGVLAAKALGMDFMDTDIAIQERENALLQDILDNKGMEYFMRLEESVLCSIDTDGTVIATGGSAVYYDKAMKHLAENGRIIYLSMSFEEIERRVKNITTRGIVMKNGSSLRDVFNEREGLYRKYSDMTIDCEGRDIEECVSLIVGHQRGLS